MNLKQLSLAALASMALFPAAMMSLLAVVTRMALRKPCI